MKISELKLNPNNPRLIKDDKFKKLVQSIKDFPEMLEKRPIVVNTDMVVLGGNMRLRACIEAGLKEVPVMVADWSEEKQKEFIIKDNVGFGEWEWDTLANEWDTDQLANWGLDFPLDFKTGEAEDDDFESPPLDQIKTDIIIGDLFEIGEHRLLCGDSTDSEQVAKLMNGEFADLWIADPPFGVSYMEKASAINGGKPSKNQEGKEIKSDTKTVAELCPFWRAAALVAYEFTTNEASNYWCACQGSDKMMMMMMMMMDEAGWNIRHELIWVKSSMVFGRSDYHYQHEPIIYGWKKKGTHNWYADRKQTSIFQIDKPSKSDLHPTTKPVELFSSFINNSSKTNDIILESFCGSGTSMVAAHQLNRRCYAVELDVKYVSVIIDRMLKLDPTLNVLRNGAPYIKSDNTPILEKEAATAKKKAKIQA